MPEYRLICAQVVASYTSIDFRFQTRPSPFEIADALKLKVEDSVGFTEACGELANAVFTAPTGKAAHELAVEKLEKCLNKVIKNKSIDAVELPLNPLAYRPGGLGTHEGLVWIRVKKGGPAADWIEDVDIRGVEVECVVCAMVIIGPAHWEAQAKNGSEASVR